MTRDADAVERLAPGEDGTHITFCRICEAFCGLTAKVEGGRITKIGPDRENPHSKGHLCVKGPAILDITYDADRVTRPLRRCPTSGAFEPVSWDEAIADIARRLADLSARHGSDAIAAYIGNPAAFSTEIVMGIGPMLKSMGFGKQFSAASQDSNPRHVASWLLYGSAMRLPIPDLPRSDFLLILGANPIVSHGSIVTAPRIREDLDEIAKRGRVVVVDPRATETAKRYEHLPIRPDTDAWLLARMIAVIFEQGLADEAFLDAHTVGWRDLRDAVSCVDGDTAASVCGISKDIIEEIAISFANSQRGCAYSRVGLCRGRFSTLAIVLQDALNVVAGKFGRPGGWVFGDSPIDHGGLAAGYDAPRSRVAPLPTVTGNLPTIVLLGEISDPGEGRIRSLFLIAGNPALSAPGGERWEEVLGELELMVAMDFYINETSRQADYILPATTFVEREDVPLLGWSHMVRPFAQYTDAIVPPVGEARSEMDVLRAIKSEMDRIAPGEVRGRIQRVDTTSMQVLDGLLRSSPVGDKSGKVPGGLSLAKLKDNPHGLFIGDGLECSGWEGKISHPEGKIILYGPEISAELERLRSSQRSEELLLFGRRELRSINSWMHNVQKLVRAQDPTLMINPIDAEARAIETGDMVEISTAEGLVVVKAEVTEDVVKGSVCYPHGWGHNGGWTTANAQDAPNINAIVPRDPGAIEQLSGASHLDGVPVSVSKVSSGY